MENYTVTKENALASVRQSVSSIFSKEDVLYLIEKIEVGSSRKITPYDIGRAIDRTIDWIENNERDVLDLDSAEFELSYNNQIECTNVPINADNIREALENNFMDFGEAEEDEVDADEKELEEIKRIEEDNN
jgi:hypothetical protein